MTKLPLIVSSVSPVYGGIKRTIHQLISIPPNRPLCKTHVSINKIQTASEMSLLCPRYGGLFGKQILKHWLHSSSDNEDDFPELDMPVPEERSTSLKLMTEMPIYGDLASPVLKNSLHTSLDDDFSELDMPVLEEQCGHVNLTTEKPKESLKCNLSSKAATWVNLPGKEKARMKCLPPEKLSHSNFVTIGKVPTTISLDQLKKAVSEFGEILNASIRYETDGFNSCDVEFKSRESKESAVGCGKIIVKLHHLPIRDVENNNNTGSSSSNNSVSVRISNISRETSECRIHSLCMQCGRVEGVSRVRAGSNSNSSCFVDVVFSVKDGGGQDIVERLDGVCAKNSWSAEILVHNHHHDDGSAEAEDGSELRKALLDLQRRCELKRIFSEDLLKLHHTLLHLQTRPLH